MFLKENIVIMSLSPNRFKNVGCSCRTNPIKQQRNSLATYFATVIWYHGCPLFISWPYV